MKKESIMSLIVVHNEIERVMGRCNRPMSLSMGLAMQLLEDVIDREGDRDSFEFYKTVFEAAKESREVKMFEMFLNKVVQEKGIEAVEKMLGEAYLKTREDLDEDRDQ